MGPSTTVVCWGSYYNGMNLGFQMTDFGRTGLIITANYTLAHSTGDLSSTFSEINSSVNGIGNLGYLDPFDPGLDHGASDFDIRQRFVFAPIYQIKWFKNNHGFTAGFWEAMRSPASTLSELALHFRSPIAAAP
jgi:hypothetical protein